MSFMSSASASRGWEECKHEEEDDVWHVTDSDVERILSSADVAIEDVKGGYGQEFRDGVEYAVKEILPEGKDVIG